MSDETEKWSMKKKTTLTPEEFAAFENRLNEPPKVLPNLRKVMAGESDMPDVIYALEGKSDTYDGVWDERQWSDQSGYKYHHERIVTELQERIAKLEDCIRDMLKDDDGQAFKEARKLIGE